MLPFYGETEKALKWF